MPGYFCREIISLNIPKQEKTEFENLIDSIVLGFIVSVIVFLTFVFLDLIFNIIKIPTLPNEELIKVINNKENLSLYEIIIKYVFLKYSILGFVLLIIIQNKICSLLFIISQWFLLPIFLGIFIGKSDGKIKLFKLEIKLFKLNPYPQAWDEFFANRKPVSIYMILKNGNKICGIYGVKSRASTNLKNKDLYLEKEIFLDKDGAIQGIIENSEGLWISKEEISYFHVFPNFY